MWLDQIWGQHPGPHPSAPCGTPLPPEAHGLSPALREQWPLDRISTGYLPPETALLRLHLLLLNIPPESLCTPRRQPATLSPAPRLSLPRQIVCLVSGFGLQGFLVLQTLHRGGPGGRGHCHITQGEEKRLSGCGYRERAGWDWARLHYASETRSLIIPGEHRPRDGGRVVLGLAFSGTRLAGNAASHGCSFAFLLFF